MKRGEGNEKVETRPKSVCGRGLLRWRYRRGAAGDHPRPKGHEEVLEIGDRHFLLGLAPD